MHETTLSGEVLPKDIIYLSTELGGAGKNGGAEAAETPEIKATCE